MSYPSVDKLQKTLAKDVFHYAKDAKKASGRALGTLVEVITFYVIQDWGFENNIRIERGLIEYLNPSISHNVEYTIHPVRKSLRLELEYKLPITTKKIFAELKSNKSAIKYGWSKYNTISTTLLSARGVLRNACVLARNKRSNLIVVLKGVSENKATIEVIEQLEKPFAMFECKRVGIEEGNKKGPQTIEKAKQGAYVARTVSSLQKVRNSNGELFGALPLGNGNFRLEPFGKLLKEVIESSDKKLYGDFILTVGVVSNHGNWFTSNNPNKELIVLKDAYDWLLFLTDRGIATFIDELLLNPSKEYKPVRDAFLVSYLNVKGKAMQYGKNQFTKVQMNREADQLLQKYFHQNRKKIRNWINIISPAGLTLEMLKTQITKLSNKDWNI